MASLKNEIEADKDTVLVVDNSSGDDSIAQTHRASADAI